MGLFFVSLFLVCLISSSHRLLCATRDRLVPGESISVSQTVVSAGQTVALGFFTPDNSHGNQYAGIWYNRIPGRTVVWVANRENPLRGPAGVLTVTKDGNLAVLDGVGRILWSTNLSGVPSNTSAVLLDSGNLVLRHGEDRDIWQSFDHPTDTVLPNMVLTANISNGAGPSLTSWKDATDPSPGEFVLITDAKTSLQAYIMKGSEIYYRGPVLNEIGQTGVAIGSLTSIYLATVYMKGQEIYSSFNMTDGSLARNVLDPAGRLSLLLWDDRARRWNSVSSIPASPCDVYNRCGPSGSCDATGNSPLSLCKCLDGFEPRNPRDWATGNFTGGCVRRVQLQCDGTDRFVKFGGMKLPDGFSVRWNMSVAHCEAECSAGCGCNAYTSASFSNSSMTDSTCLLWFGELIDLGQTNALVSGDLYVRLSSKLDNNTLDGGLSPNKNKALIKIILPVLSVGVLLIGICGYFSVKRLKSRVEDKRKTRKMLLLGGPNFSDVIGDGKDISDVPLLDFKSLKAATSNFSSVNKLGEGGFGPVYKGRLLNGREVAVKRLSKGSKQGCQEFVNEVRLVGKLQHKNLVRLLGWCIHEDERILIYEFMPSGSLDKFIFDTTRSTELTWDKRFRIIEGIANGLLYLHQYSRMRIIHRDLKASNIVLDGEMNPKISDFGLARIFKVDQTEANTGKVVGTLGYMSPEYALDGVFSERSDVFSFGVMLLEIITGKRSNGFYPCKNSQNLLGYSWQMWEEGRTLELPDPSMGKSFQASEVMRCTQLGLLCVQEQVADRPTMSTIVSLLGNETCTLAIPRPPAFTIGRNPIPPLLHDGTSKKSINELTRSSVQGR